MAAIAYPDQSVESFFEFLVGDPLYVYVVFIGLTEKYEVLVGLDEEVLEGFVYA